MLWFKPNIAKMESRRDTAGVMRALTHWDAKVRREAALALGRMAAPHSDGQGLGQIGNTSAVAALCKALSDRDWEVCMAAAEALGKIGGPEATDALCRALEQYRRVGPTSEAVRALARIGDPRAIETLFTVYSKWVGSGVRDVLEAVLWAFTRMTDRAAVEPLCRVLSNAPDSDLADAVRKALEAIGSASVPGLSEVITGGTRDGRRAAARALVKVGDIRALEALRASLDDEDDLVRECAAEALGNIGSDTAIEALCACYGDSCDRVRQSVLRALTKIGSTAALLSALESEHSCVREAAAAALGHIGDPAAIAPLCRVLHDDAEEKVQLAAVGALKRLGASDALCTALDSDRREVRRAAALALGEAGGAGAVDPLIDALSVEDCEIRRAAADALGSIGDARATEPLIAILQRDDSYEVRTAAALALGRLGGERALSALLEADRKDTISEDCLARALGYMDDSRAEKELYRLLRSGRPVAKTARNVLNEGRRGDQEHVVCPNCYYYLGLRGAVRSKASPISQQMREEASRRGIDIIADGYYPCPKCKRSVLISLRD